MASKITRKTAVQFGGSLAASGNVAIFGSLALNTIGYSIDPAVIQAAAAWLGGWASAVVGNNAPAKQDRNAVDYVFSWQIAYLLQQGLAEYDPATVYWTNGFCASAGVIYISTADNNLGNPVTNTNFWKTLASTVAPSFNSGLLCKAWVKFAANGSAGFGIVASSNAGISVARNSAGIFTLTFPAGIFADANYTWSGAASAANGGSIGSSGNNNHLIGGGLQSQTQLRVANWEAVSSLGPEDADFIGMMFFGN
jgi:hypothetical protein